MSNNVKETVIQFGEGGFLRGFVDYFFHKLQENPRDLYIQGAESIYTVRGIYCPGRKP